MVADGGYVVICPSCNREFEPPFKPKWGTKILCRVCYAESTGNIDMAFAEVAWRQGYEFGYKTGLRDAGDGTRTLISEQLVTEALILTHPDRHPKERFAAANTVTASLISLRDSIRRLTERKAS